MLMLMSTIRERMERSLSRTKKRLLTLEMDLEVNQALPLRQTAKLLLLEVKSSLLARLISLLFRPSP
jgi:hypothetical protein